MARGDRSGEVTKRSWVDPTGVINATNNFSRKLRRLRKTLKKWERESFGSVRIKKEKINKQIVELEMKAELEQLSLEEWDLLRDRRKELSEILNQEEIMWRQRVRLTWLKEGDRIQLTSIKSLIIGRDIIR